MLHDFCSDNFSWWRWHWEHEKNSKIGLWILAEEDKGCFIMWIFLWLVIWVQTQLTKDRVSVALCSRWRHYCNLHFCIFFPSCTIMKESLILNEWKLKCREPGLINSHVIWFNFCPHFDRFCKCLNSQTKLPFENVTALTSLTQ